MRATDLLKRQHDEVKGIFEALRDAEVNERAELRQRLATALRAHNQMEEELLYPRFEEKEGFEELIANAWEQHEEATAALAELERLAVDEAGFDDQLGLVQDLVLEHVALEENEVIPRIEQVWTNDMLEELGADMRERFDQLLEAGGEEARV